MYNCVTSLPNLSLKQIRIFTMTTISGSAVDLQNSQQLKFSLPARLQMLKSPSVHRKLQ